MSKYTTEVRYICESAIGLQVSTGADRVDEVISQAVGKIFNFDFPIFDETYRNVLERKILKHYYTREIGEETVGLWKLRLNTKLNEIMPYYNKMYQSELIEFNPLYTKYLERNLNKTGNVNSNENGTENRTEDRTNNRVLDRNDGGTYENHSLGDTRNDNSSTGDSTNDGKNLYSDTPQGSIQNLENNTYLTNATIENDVNHNHEEGWSTAHASSDTNGSSTVNAHEVDSDNGNVTIVGSNVIGKVVNSTDEYVELIKGYEGLNPSKAIMEYRESLLNIDMMIIRDLEVLFMQLW